MLQCTTLQKISVLWGVASLSVLVVIGYFVTPVLFASLPEKQAGDIAALLFDGAALFVLLGLLFALVSYLAVERHLKSVKSLIVAAFLLVALRFWLGPWMADLKSDYPYGLTRQSVDWSVFAALHGAYQLLYLTIIALLLIWVVKVHFQLGDKVAVSLACSDKKSL